MLRRWIPVLGMVALVSTVLLLVAESASAAPRDRRAMRRGYDSGPAYSQAMPAATVTASEAVAMTEEPATSTRRAGLFGRRTRPGNTATAMTTRPGTTDSERRSFYGGPSASGPVQLSVRLPAEAELRIDGLKTTSTGPMRRFISPAIEAGPGYSYELQAKWMENGREVTRTRTVNVRAGELVNIDFLSPSRADNPTP